MSGRQTHAVELDQRILATLAVVDESCRDGTFGSIMEDIRDQLRQMEREIDVPVARRDRLRAGLGRLVTDSVELMADPLGEDLAQLCEAYAPRSAG